MLGFEVFQAADEAVEGSIGDFRIVLDVIEIFVMPDFFAQAFDFGGGAPFWFGRHGNLGSGMQSVKSAGYYTMRDCFVIRREDGGTKTNPCLTESKTRS